MLRGSQWGKNYTPLEEAPADPAIDNKNPPLVQVNKLDGVAMLGRLAELHGRLDVQIRAKVSQVTLVGASRPCKPSIRYTLVHSFARGRLRPGAILHR